MLATTWIELDFKRVCKILIKFCSRNVESGLGMLY